MLDYWKFLAESKGLNVDIVKCDAKERDECLSRFFADIRKSDGSDYKPDSLRVISVHWLSSTDTSNRTKAKLP